jgi:hypothetical protein
LTLLDFPPIGNGVSSGECRRELTPSMKLISPFDISKFISYDV